MSSILRLCPPRNIVYIVWVNIFFIVSTSVGCLAFIFSSCQPFAATWNTLLYVYPFHLYLQATTFHMLLGCNL